MKAWDRGRGTAPGQSQLSDLVNQEPNFGKGKMDSVSDV